MAIILALLAILVAVWLFRSFIIVVRGNDYHGLVRQAVIAEVGPRAVPYLQSRPIVEQITNAFRRGDPASSTAMALALLIEQETGDNENEKLVSNHTPANAESPTAMDAVIKAVYGDHPPAKSAILEQATGIAHADLLFGKVPLSEVKQVAGALFSGPIPYSTVDLAVSTALAFYRNPEFQGRLLDSQMPARLRVLNWLKAGKVVGPLAQSFENTLYRIYQTTHAEPQVEAEEHDDPQAAAAIYFEEAVELTDQTFARMWKFDPNWVGLLSVATDLDKARGNSEQMIEIAEVVVEAFREGRTVAECSSILLLKHLANQRALEKLTRSPLWLPGKD